MRITQKTLEGLCRTLNEVTGRPVTTHIRTEVTGFLKSRPGNIHIEPMNGYYNLVEIAGPDGGVNTRFSGKAAECYAYLRGRLEAFSDVRAAVGLIANLDNASPSDLNDTLDALLVYTEHYSNTARRRKLAGLLVHFVSKVSR